MTDFAFVFPGQGSQAVGMLKELSEQCPAVRDTFAEASDALGYDLYDLAMNGPAEDLNETSRAQPALLTASTALCRLWRERGGPEPVAAAGHSLGEYSALVCAGVLEFADAVRLTKLRGEFMREAVPAGRGLMAAVIGLPDETVAAACAEAAEGLVCSPVNFNSPGQVVISGDRAAVERAGEILKKAGAKRVLPLAVSVPSHCALMKPAAERLAEELAKIKFAAPRIPVINNVDVAAAEYPEEIRDALVRQLYSPVRWVETVRALSALGVKLLVEAGPGKVLAGLTKRIDKDLSATSLNDPATLQAALDAVA